LTVGTQFNSKIVFWKVAARKDHNKLIRETKLAQTHGKSRNAKTNIKPNAIECVREGTKKSLSELKTEKSETR